MNQLTFLLSKFTVFSLVLLISSCANYPEGVFIIENPNDFKVENAAISISLSEFSEPEIPEMFELTDQNQTVIPYQLDDLDQDGKKETLFLQISLAANTSTSISFRKVSEIPVYPSKTDAVFKIRDQADPENMQVGSDFRSVESFTEQEDLQQDNGIIFLEGPGWESNLVGYRFYFDDRNRFDIFGKSTNDLALENISEEYHTRRPWGADVLKVGSTLGIGSPALFKDGAFHAIEKTGLKTLEIISNGPLRSIIKVSYPNWEVNDVSTNAEMELEIHANHRYTELRLKTNGENLSYASGLVMHPNIDKILVNEADTYITGYTWGNQTDLEEILGMGIIFPKSLSPVYEGEIQGSYTFSINSMNSEIVYRFMAAWELEPDEAKISSEEAFEKYLNQVAKQWQHPLTVTVKN